MFLQFFVVGSFNPLISLYLTRFLGLGGGQAGLIISISQVSMLISPLLVGRIAGKKISERRLLIIIYIAGAALLLLTSVQKGFAGMLLSFFALNLMLGPAVGLMNAVTFKRLPDPSAFGGIRVWGTIGWMAAGWTNGALVQLLPGISSSLSLIFTLPALASLLFTFLAVLLPGGGSAPTPAGGTGRRKRRSSRSEAGADTAPRTPPDAGAGAGAGGEMIDGTTLKDTAGPEKGALGTLLSPIVRVLILCHFLGGMLDRYYIFGSGPHLDFMGVPESLLMPILSLGQATEIFMLLMLKPMLKRLGFRKGIIAGSLFLVLRYVLLLTATGSHAGALPAVVLAIAMNGPVLAMFYTALTIYVDEQTSPGDRPAVHQYIAMVFTGFAGFSGNSLAGITFSNVEQNLQGMQSFWSIPLSLSLVVAGIIFLFFRPGKLKSAG